MPFFIILSIYFLAVGGEVVEEVGFIIFGVAHPYPFDVYSVSLVCFTFVSFSGSSVTSVVCCSSSRGGLHTALPFPFLPQPKQRGQKLQAELPHLENF